MGKDVIKLAEKKIKEYFEIEEKIKVMRKIISSLEEKIELLEDKNKYLNLNFNIDIKNNSINGMPKSINTGSYFENSIIKQIEINENTIKKINDEIFEQENKIINLEITNEKTKNIISILRNDFKEMLFLRYKEKETEVYICNKLNLSKSQYHILKNRTLISVYNLLIMYKEDVK